MSGLKELQDAVYAAQKVENDIAGLIRTEKEEAGKAIDEKYAGEVRAAHATLVAAQVALRTEKDRLAREKKDTRHPIGTVFIEWNKGRGYDACRDWRKTGVRGVWEVCTTDSQFPSNHGGRPKIGEEFIRVLKKDGSPSLKCARRGCYDRDSDPWGWYLEGVDPNK